MKVVIIEDEAPAARRLEKLLQEQKEKVDVLAKLDSVSSAIDWFNANPAPDLVLMDIQLSDGLSFEIFDQITLKSPIIFTTAFDDYAIKAFKVNSIDYLLKPIDKDELAAALNKFKNLNKDANEINIDFLEVLKEFKAGTAQYKSRFLVKLGQKFIPIPITDVAYFYAENKGVYLVSKSGNRYVIDSSLDQLEQELDPNKFTRANRQYMLAEDAIESIHTSLGSKLKVYVKPAAEETIWVSKEKAAGFKRWLNK